MADWNQALAARGIANLDTYANKLDALQISESIRNGAGPNSMSTVDAAWSQLGETLEKLKSTYDKITAELRESCSGAPGMAAQITSHTNWMSETSITARHTADLLLRMSNAHRKVRDDTAAPSDIRENRSRLESFKRSNPTGTQSVEIAELEWQYQQWQTQNIAAMVTYGRITTFTVSELLSFTTVQPSAGVIPVKDPKRASHDPLVQLS